MTPDKILKAFLITIGGICTAIAANDFFSPACRAVAGVVLGGSAPLLAYLLKPVTEPAKEQPENLPREPPNGEQG